METLNLRQIIADYKTHKIQNIDKSHGRPAVRYNQYRDYLSEIMALFGVNSELFKEGRIKNQPFRFACDDKELLFEMLDKFTDDEFLLIRQGEFHSVDPETMEFYINAFKTMLSHLAIPSEEIDTQISIMEKSVLFHFFLHFSNAKKAITDLNNDLCNKFFDDDDLIYEDKITFLKYMTQEVKSFQDRMRHIYLQMSDRRMHDELSQEIAAFKSLSDKDRTYYGDSIKNHIRLQERLSKNDRYTELCEAEEKIFSDTTMLKKKAIELEKIYAEMDKITKDNEVELFGNPLSESNKRIQLNHQDFLVSEVLLDEAIRFYQKLIEARKTCEPNNPMITDVLCKDKFER